MDFIKKNVFRAVFVFLSITSLTVFSQDLTIEMQKFPFSDVIEWPEHGLVLFAKDPSKNTLQQELSYVNQKGELIWQEHYIPMVENPFIIASQESDYIYFLDQINPDESGKIYYNQMSLSGYIKKGSIYFPPIFRTLNNDNLLDYKLIDVINAHDDLIFHFRQEDKKNKQFIDVLVFYSHVLLKAFPVKIPGVYLTAELDAGTKSLIQYAGSKDGANYFCSAATKTKVKGYDLFTYNDKGELIETSFMDAPKETVSPLQIQSNELNGAYYLRAENPAYIGQLHYYKNAFYLIGGNEQAGISLWKYTNNTPGLLLSNISMAHKKSNLYTVGANFLNNQLIVFTQSDLENKNTVYSLDTKVVHTSDVSGNAYERNPSRLLFAKNSTNFVLKLNDVVFEFNKQIFAPSVEKVVFKRQ
jgi:hypothetical protein